MSLTTLILTFVVGQPAEPPVFTEEQLKKPFEINAEIRAGGLLYVEGPLIGKINPVRVESLDDHRALRRFAIQCTDRIDHWVKEQIESSGEREEHSPATAPAEAAPKNAGDSDSVAEERILSFADVIEGRTDVKRIYIFEYGPGGKQLKLYRNLDSNWLDKLDRTRTYEVGLYLPGYRGNTLVVSFVHERWQAFCDVGQTHPGEFTASPIKIRKFKPTKSVTLKSNRQSYWAMAIDFRDRRRVAVDAKHFILLNSKSGTYAGLAGRSRAEVALHEVLIDMFSALGSQKVQTADILDFQEFAVSIDTGARDEDKAIKQRLPANVVQVCQIAASGETLKDSDKEAFVKGLNQLLTDPDLWQSGGEVWRNAFLKDNVTPSATDIVRFNRKLLDATYSECLRNRQRFAPLSKVEVVRAPERSDSAAVQFNRHTMGTRVEPRLPFHLLVRINPIDD